MNANPAYQSLLMLWASVSSNINSLVDSDCYELSDAKELKQYQNMCEQFFSALKRNEIDIELVDFLFSEEWEQFIQVLKRDNFKTQLQAFSIYFTELLNLVMVDPEIKQPEQDIFMQFVKQINYCYNCLCDENMHSFTFLTNLFLSIGIVRPMIYLLSTDPAPHRQVFKSSILKLSELQNCANHIEMLDSILKMIKEIQSKYASCYPTMLDAVLDYTDLYNFKYDAIRRHVVKSYGLFQDLSKKYIK